MDTELLLARRDVYSVGNEELDSPALGKPHKPMVGQLIQFVYAKDRPAY